LVIEIGTRWRCSNIGRVIMGHTCIHDKDVNERELDVDERDEMRAESTTQGRGDDRRHV